MKLKSIFILFIVFLLTFFSSTSPVSAHGINKTEKHAWGTRGYVDTENTPALIDRMDHEFRTGSNAGGGFLSLILGGILGLYGGAIGGVLLWRLNTGIDYAIREMKTLNNQGKGIIIEFIKFSVTFKVYSQ